MKNIEVKINTETSVTIDGKPVYEYLKMACDLAHEVLEELSVYRQEKGVDDEFYCEGSACAFLDAIGD